jgi:hypothetical protein
MCGPVATTFEVSNAGSRHPKSLTLRADIIYEQKSAPVCRNFRNQNPLQSLQRKQHEVSEFEGDKLVGPSRRFSNLDSALSLSLPLRQCRGEGIELKRDPENRKLLILLNAKNAKNPDSPK